ncbi:MAG: VOC family protein [Bacillota bacterium]|nr:VOC family protein [Bacillota bacterium]
MIKGIAHLAFQVADMDRAVRFYETALGFHRKFTLEDDRKNPWIVYLQINDRQFIELFYANRPLLRSAETVSYQHLCIEVEDIHSVARSLENSGIHLVHPVIRGLDHNWQCWIADPDGNPIELMEYGEGALQLA